MRSSMAIAAAALMLLAACGGNGQGEGNGAAAEAGAEAANAAQVLDTPDDVVVAPDETAMGNGVDVATDANMITPEAEANAQ